jgi:superfamily II DNA or RNA helicase
MQNSGHSSSPNAGRDVHRIRVGDIVSARSRRWHVVDVRDYDDCRLITVRGMGHVDRGEQSFLLPFETVIPLNRRTRLRFVRPQRWRRACREILAAHAPPGALRAARNARINLLPYQLEPVLAFVHGLGTRMLLADDVGLGKTVQAGLAIAELQARGMAERVLILTPAGLRDQWASELSDRFGMAAAIVDSRSARLRIAGLAVGVNPWSTIPVAVTSIDFVKRIEVLRAVQSCQWDVIVIDEAHGTAREGERHAAVASLASRAAYVVMLTATPHNGETRAFDALCRTGAHGDPLLFFRRTRADVNVGVRRRIHCLHVRPSRAEVHMHAELSLLTLHVRSEPSPAWLALSVLHKRALSSARSLQRSIERRVALLDPKPFELQQLGLPLSDPSGDFDDSDEAPDWEAGRFLGDVAREDHMLHRIAAAARDAARAETKFAAVVRLLDRIREPVIIFTEYRDTLLNLRDVLTSVDRGVSLLHGGLSREERAAAIEDFVNGRRRILLSTDAGGEGLNLHQRCRIVINLELPWNPMRLEQRTGRVDRIGQSRTVHIFHLIARDTGESRILERLKARIARVRQDITAADPTMDAERAAAEAVMGSLGPACEELAEEPAAEAGKSDRIMVRLASQATAEVQRLSLARRLAPSMDATIHAALEAEGPWLTTARNPLTRCRLASNVAAIYTVESEDGHGRVIGSTLVPIAITLSNRELMDLDVIRSVLNVVGVDLQARATAASAEMLSNGTTIWQAMLATRLAREGAIAAAIAGTPRSAWQPGLFDRRADHDHRTARAEIDEAIAGLSVRIEACHRAGIVFIRPARLLLILAP